MNYSLEKLFGLCVFLIVFSKGIIYFGKLNVLRIPKELG
jgi:hypothetical protein